MDPIRQEAAGITGKQIADSISGRLGREALAVEVNGEVWDLSQAHSRRCLYPHFYVE